MLASSPPRILPVASFLPTAPPKRRPATQPIPTHPPTLHGHGHGVLLLCPPSSRLLLGAAPRSRVAWRGVDWRSSSPSVDQGAIRPRFGLGFTSPFLFLSLVRNPSLPILLCEQGQRSRKDQIFPSGLCSKRREGEKSSFLPLLRFFLSIPFSLYRIACCTANFCLIFSPRYLGVGDVGFNSITCGSAL